MPHEPSRVVSRRCQEGGGKAPHCAEALALECNAGRGMLRAPPSAEGWRTSRRGWFSSGEERERESNGQF